MNWFRQYVVDPSGMCFWREGMRVTNEALVEAFNRDEFISAAIAACAPFGVVVGEA